MTEENLKKYLSDSLYKKYKRYIDSLELSKNPNVRWCVSPNCPHYIERKKDEKKIVCECGQEICFDCGQQWHTKSCEA